MRKVINISVPEPCHEDWNQMTLLEKGRHCDVCSKTVIDFTNSSDEQLITSFEKEKNLCGRFKTTQLNRDVVLNRKEKNNYISLAASGLFAFLSLNSNEAQAQGAPKVVQSDSTYHNQILGKTATSVANQRVVSGIVLGKNNYRIPNAFVTIKGTQKYVKTDFGGEFSIKIKKNDTLIIESYAYEKLELKTSKVSKYKITLIPSKILVSETVGGPVINSVLTESQTSVLGGAVGNVQVVNYSSRERRKLIREELLERSSFGDFLYSISNIFRSKK